MQPTLVAPTDGRCHGRHSHDPVDGRRDRRGHRRRRDGRSRPGDPAVAAGLRPRSLMGGNLDLRATWLATKVTGHFSSRLAGRFASRLWFTPWPVPVGERARAKQAGWLAGTQPVTFDVGTHRIAGFSAGEGPAVLLVHGWGERAASLGAFVAPLVGAGFRVVGVDLPGHGET